MAGITKMMNAANLIQHHTKSVAPAADSIEEKLPITVNGYEKYATGLTKRTTVDDVKFAMLTVSDPTFKPENLDDYAIVEKWQGNERVLDGKIKIYKLIRLWQSLPGDQLSQVKFSIKRRKHILSSSHNMVYADQPQPHMNPNKQTQKPIKLAHRDSNIIESSKHVLSNKKKTMVNSPSAPVGLKAENFAFCTLSPALQKTWALEKAKRKSSYVKRQLRMTSQTRAEALSSSLSSLSEAPSSSSLDSLSSSDVDDDLNNDSERRLSTHRRYASIKSFNRSRKSTIKQTQQMKKSFIELVNKQNEIIDKQLSKLAEPARDISATPSSSKPSNKITKYTRSKSLDKYERKQALIKSTIKSSNNNLNQCDEFELDQEINDNDIKLAFTSGKTHHFDDKQVKEYTKICNDYFKLQSTLSSKLKHIEDLKSELDQIQQTTVLPVDEKELKLIQKANKKLQSSIEVNKAQDEKISDMNSALSNIDDIISLKTKFIESLEKELERLECLENTNSPPMVQQPPKKSIAYASASSTSSTSSTSSVLTSISSVSNSRAAAFNAATLPCYQQKMMMTGPYTSYGGNSGADNESDTGISSANSDDFNTQLETLV